MIPCVFRLENAVRGIAIAPFGLKICSWYVSGVVELALEVVSICTFDLFATLPG